MTDRLDQYSVAALITMVRMQTGMAIEQLAAKFSLSWGQVMKLEAGQAEASDGLREELEGLLISGYRQGGKLPSEPGLRK